MSHGLLSAIVCGASALPTVLAAGAAGAAAVFALAPAAAPAARRATLTSARASRRTRPGTTALVPTRASVASAPAFAPTSGLAPNTAENTSGIPFAYGLAGVNPGAG